MGSLSKNIDRSECSCKCGCGFQTADIETVNVIQEACDYFAKKLGLDRVHATINSWCRCVKHNKSKDVGGAPNSKHLEGTAADWFIAEVSPKELYDYLTNKYPNKYGIGLYPGRIHFDCRPIKYHYLGK